MYMREKALAILESMNEVILGKESAMEKVLLCFLSQGHILIEDVPGVGKTTVVKVLAKCLGLNHSRIQFTPDLMPSDITGVTFYNQKEGQFIFRKGPIFSNIVLADEINRTSPKTQSSLLQAMEEGEVSTETDTLSLEKPFMVLATQNPVEYQGTFPLPEAQLDRFLMKISLGYPQEDKEMEMIKSHHINKSLEHIQPKLSLEEIRQMQAEVEAVYVQEDIIRYIVEMVNVTRIHQDIVLGASPRASLDLYRGAKALAYIRGRSYVLPDDVKGIVADVFNHRILLSPQARMDGKQVQGVIQELLTRVKVPVVKTVEV